MLKLSLIGYIGKDAEVTELKGHKAIKFSIGVSEIKDTPTTWVNATYFNNGAIAPYLKKGTKVYIDGKVNISAYSSNNELKPSINLTVQNLTLLGDGSNK